MPFSLDNVVPWGRSLEEHVAMFALSRQDMESRIVACADGPASFNAEMKAQGHFVASVDPIYQFSPEEIRRQIDKIYETVMRQLRDNQDDFVWTKIPSPEALGRLRLESMNRFLLDFPDGVKEGRYVACELPDLPFEDQAFDLALCSHFLFLYSDRLSVEFHIHSIEEMLRVARDVRVFPLLKLDGRPSDHLDVVRDHFHESGRTCEIKTVDYEFQRGGNQMLRIR